MGNVTRSPPGLHAGWRQCSVELPLTSGQSNTWLSGLNCTLDVWCPSHYIPEAAWIIMTTKSKTHLTHFHTAQRRVPPLMERNNADSSPRQRHCSRHLAKGLSINLEHLFTVITDCLLDNSCPEASVLHSLTIFSFKMCSSARWCWSVLFVL